MQPKKPAHLDGPLPELELDDPAKTTSSRAPAPPLSAARAKASQPPHASVETPASLAIDLDYAGGGPASTKGPPSSRHRAGATSASHLVVTPPPASQRAILSSAALDTGRPSAASLPSVVLEGGVIDTPEGNPALPGVPADEAREANALAAFGAAPSGLVGAGLYTTRVFLRKRVLREELAPLRRASSDAAHAIERRFVSLGEKLRDGGARDPALGALVTQARELEAAIAASATRHPLARESARADLEQALGKLGRRAVALDAPGAREEIAGLERLAAARKRDVRLRELALRSVDSEVYRRGRVALGLLAAVLLLLFLAPALKNTLFPPAARPLPPDVGAR